MSNNGIRINKGIPQRSDAAVRRSLARTISGIKRDLVGDFNTHGVKPLAEIRHPNSPVKIYHFTANELERSFGWKEFDTGVLRSFSREVDAEDFFMIDMDQLTVSESPAILSVGVATCAIVTLYDRQRKVGAAIHIDADNLFTNFHEKLISMALFKMGVLRGRHLLNVEAGLFGVGRFEGVEDGQAEWGGRMRAFLESCSLRVLHNEVGKETDIRFYLRDGHIEKHNIDDELE